MNYIILNQSYLASGLSHGSIAWIIARENNNDDKPITYDPYFNPKFIEYDPFSKSVYQITADGFKEFTESECEQYGFVEAIKKAEANPPTVWFGPKEFMDSIKDLGD